MTQNSDGQQLIEELQVVERNLQHLLAQRQNLGVEINEVENALDEIGNYDGEVYKIVGGVMIETKKENVVVNLEEKKRETEMKIGAISKQEKILENRARELREIINKSMTRNK